MEKISVILVYLISFIYFEFLYKLLIGIDIFQLSWINILLFLIPFSLLLYLFTNSFKKTKWNKLIFVILLTVVGFWFSVQYVIKGYFGFYMSLSNFKVADQVGEFFGKAVIETLKRLPGICLFFLPVVLGVIFRKYISFNKNNWKKILITTVLFFSFCGLYLVGLNIEKDRPYSVHALYYDVNDVSLNINNLGVINTFFIDVKRTLFGFEEKVVALPDYSNDVISSLDEEEDTVVFDYNLLDINFEELFLNETNETLRDMHEYFMSDTGTLKNEYSGMFKDKNLILFMAESYNEIAVDEKLTPTLYKLVNNGFIFENFYTPSIYSTIGGEFQELTGLYAQSTDILSKFRSGDIYFPQGLGTKFKEKEYSTYAYHNNSYTFQDRNKYLKSLGFTNFKACNNGLEKLINCNEWPQSDVSMIKATVNDYINKDKFMVFYSSVSGHSSYNWSSNAVASRNKKEYLKAGYSYSEGPASYLAAQMELDKALELLISELEEAGRLEDTVIALVGDHYPYELSLKEINEISTFERDSVVTVNKSNFIIWNSEMDNVTVEKIGSQIDVMPTLYNLFDISYDSRLFVGKDILSNEMGLAIFANRSWVSDMGTYFSASGKFVPSTDDYDPDYVTLMNKIVNNKIVISKKIIEENYYKKIFK